jgi:hypothetical protein
MTATVVKRLVRDREGPNERAEDKLSTVGTRTGSEAGNSGRAGEHKRSPTVIKLDSVEPDGARGKNQHRPGEIPGVRAFWEVSRGHSSEEAQ